MTTRLYESDIMRMRYSRKDPARRSQIRLWHMSIIARCPSIPDGNMSIYMEHKQSFIRELIDGKIDLLAGLARTDEREEIIAYPDAPMGSGLYNLIKHDFDNSVTSDPASFEGRKIGVLDSILVNALNDYLKDQEVSADIVLYDDYVSLFEDFDNGELEIIAVEGNGAYSRENSVVLCTFGSADFYLCVSKDRQDLLFELNNAQTMLASEEPNYITNLRNRYFSGSVSSLAFS